jgi:molybdopterin-biosynthesis enzyme MoeA-like protein
MGAKIGHRADAMALLQAHYDRSGLPFNEAGSAWRASRRCRADRQPGFHRAGLHLGNVHVMAGVPNIFQAMVASVLPKLTGGPPLLSQSLRVDRGEGEIAGPFGALAAEFPDLSMGSYPFIQNGAHGTNLVIRGTDPGRLAEAMVKLTRLFG